MLFKYIRSFEWKKKIIEFKIDFCHVCVERCM